MRASAYKALFFGVVCVVVQRRQSPPHLLTSCPTRHTLCSTSVMPHQDCVYRVLLLWALASLTASISSPPWFSWRPCSNSTAQAATLVTITNVSVTPHVPHRGSQLVFQLQGTLAQASPCLSATTLDVRVAYQGMTVFTKHGDLCAATSCPLCPGAVQVLMLGLHTTLCATGEMAVCAPSSTTTADPKCTHTTRSHCLPPCLYGHQVEPTPLAYPPPPPTNSRCFASRCRFSAVHSSPQQTTHRSTHKTRPTGC